MDRFIGPRPSKTEKRKQIWIHALSVGEVISAMPLIKMLKGYYPHNRIVLTVKTASGLMAARNLAHGMVERIMIMPHDFLFAINRIYHFINPSLYILVETDIWPGTLNLLRKRGVPRILVNGRISPRTFKSHKKFGFIAQKIWESLDLCLMQTEIDRERLLDIGVNPTKVKIAGNIKFDQEWRQMDDAEKKGWLKNLQLDDKDRIWVAGSVHQGEFGIILDSYDLLRRKFQALRLIIVPRKIEHAEDILLACKKRGLTAVRKTALSEYNMEYQVLILDTIGELRRIYGLAEVSFVGGSLVPIGGHNLLEPASFGQPVLFGPHTHNFELMAENLIECGGGKRVRDREGLVNTLEELLLDPALSRAFGLAARRFVDMNRGALNTVREEIENTLAIF